MRGPPKQLWCAVHAGTVGAVLGLTLLKFGNPAIFDARFPAPQTAWEWLIYPWPLLWGYLLLAAVVLAAIPLWRLPPGVPNSVSLLPLGWLGWQILSATQTIEPALSHPTLRHFAACSICFYLGLMVLSRSRNLDLFWLGVLGGMLGVISWGFDQHFIGLDAVRQEIYSQPGWQDKYPPEFLAKLASNRIYSTLFYPNALAGVLLLLGPPLLVWSWQFGARRGSLLGGLLLAAVGGGGMACLFWSGSKGGWIIGLTMALIAGGHWILQAQPPGPSAQGSTPKRAALGPSSETGSSSDLLEPASHPASGSAAGWPLRRTVVAWTALGLVLAFGLGTFYLRYQGYFRKGAASVGARIGYWRAAVSIAREYPVLGSGPGTFGVLYAQLRPEGAEMARLAHNDYLQQASDSGLIGSLLFLALIPLSLVRLGRARGRLGSPLDLAIWLGLGGWAVQEGLEFGLHIPALAWPAFLLLGLLWGKGVGNGPGSDFLIPVRAPG